MTVRINQHPSSVTDQATQESTQERRFGGLRRLYGDVGFRRVVDSHVCVIGVGGVGSWAVEALARSAVGQITMIDMDVVAPSNVNRQLHALDSTFGRDKTAVLEQRCRDINPQCKIHIIDEFLNKDNLAQLIDQRFDSRVRCCQ